MTTYDWSEFDVHMLLPCSRGEAFRSWATSGGMERFFARRMSYTAPGRHRARDGRAGAGRRCVRT